MQVSSGDSMLIGVKRFSSLHRLLRTLACVFIFIYKLRRKNISMASAYAKSKRILIQMEQSSHFLDEIRFLSEDRTGNIPVLVKNLNLFIDSEGLVRSKGRLANCLSLSYEVANPVILPSYSHVSRLLIWHFHHICNHMGVNTTLTKMRAEGFWILRGRKSISSVLNKCVTCKKFNSRPFNYPTPTDLPSERVNLVRPFYATGIDFTGAFYVNLNGSIVKMYLAIYTCMTIRALYVDLVPEMSAKSFLLSFINFCSLFCTPSVIYSDNQNTFLFAMKLVGDAHIDDDWADYLLKNSITHKKIPLYSAWHGSTYERLIRVIKSCIFKTVGRRKLEYFQFKSLLAEICQTINNRPLTYQSEDSDLSMLTPNHFLKPGSSPTILFGNMQGEQIIAPNRKALIDTLAKREELLEFFKQKYYEEYLTSLRERDYNLYQDNWTNVIKKGDVVHIKSPNLTRSYWVMGIVEDLLPGRDGKVRSAKIKKPSGSCDIHSILHLYPLELSVEECDVPLDKECLSEMVSQPRGRRKAAEACLNKIKSCV